MAVINDFQVNGLNPSIVGGTGTTPKYFPRLLGSSIGVQSVAPSATSAAGQLVVPGFGELNGQWFDVLVGVSFGSDTGDPSGTVKIELVANTSQVVSSPNYVVLASTTAVVPAAQPGDIAIKASLIGSTKSGVAQGYYVALANGALNNTTPKALDNNLSGINFVSMSPFGLAVRATFGTSDPSNTASLYQFQIVGS